MKMMPSGDSARTAMNELVLLWSVINVGAALFVDSSGGQTQEDPGRSDARTVLVGTRRRRLSPSRTA